MKQKYSLEYMLIELCKNHRLISIKEISKGYEITLVNNTFEFERDHFHYQAESLVGAVRQAFIAIKNII
jgi:hypothetical protein